MNGMTVYLTAGAKHFVHLCVCNMLCEAENVGC